MLRRRRLWYLAGSVAFFALLALLVVAVVVKAAHPAFGARGPFWLVGALAVFWLVLLSRACLQYRRVRRDLREGRADSVAGTVTHRLSLTPGVVAFFRHRVRCGERVFSVPQEVFFRLQSGRKYRVYYARHSETFLGAVPCPSASSGSSPRAADESPEDVALSLPLSEQADMDPLLEREQEVLERIAAGLSNQEIADELYLSVHTVKMYASQLYRKLGVQRRTEAVRRGREVGLLPPLRK